MLTRMIADKTPRHFAPQNDRLGNNTLFRHLEIGLQHVYVGQLTLHQSANPVILVYDQVLNGSTDAN